MYKYFIKIFLIFGFLYITFGAIEDPVARHDLSECSTYLCPKYRVMAEDYMREGCVGEFKDYVLKGSLKEDVLKSTLKEDVTLKMISENSVNEDKSVNINSVLILSTLSSIISLYIGFYIGKKEKEKEHIFLMKEFD